jgi:hypothetical protein
MFSRSAATAMGNGGNPFAPQSAFDADSLGLAPVVFTAYDGSGSFKSSEVMSSSASTDHLSVGVGVGVDLVFLEASVSVHYDGDVMGNRDSNKASHDEPPRRFGGVRASARALGGCVTQQQCAQLCECAVVVELLPVPVECLRQVRYWAIAL